MLYRSCCRAFLFHFILLKEFHLYDAQSSRRNNDTSESIFIQIDNRLFQLNAMKKTWWDAVLNCKQNGMILGEVRTMNEARLLSQKMLKSRPVAIENAWIGGYKKLPRKKNTEWRWLSNDEKIEDDNELWMEHTDKDSKSDLESTSLNSHCLLLDWHLHAQTNPTYVKASCDLKRGFICQKINQTIVESVQPIISASQHEIVPSHSNVSTPNHRSLTTPVPTYSTSTTVETTKNPPSKITGKKKRKKKKEITTPPPTTITASTEEEYSDLKMWEFGKAQMKMWKKKKEKENRKKKMFMQKKSDSLKRIRIQEPNYDFITTQKPESTPPITKKSLEPLQLYYAFEGPMVGGLTATPMPHEESDSEEKNISARRYHKYINRRKYNQYLERKQTSRY